MTLSGHYHFIPCQKMYGSACLVSVFLHLCMMNITTAVHEDITGGIFLKDKFMHTYIILSYDQVGPMMCVADCLMYTDCNAVNYRPDQLHCQLLTETSPVNQLWNRTGSCYSQMESWRKVNKR
jgi:hypothetical protein